MHFIKKTIFTLTVIVLLSCKNDQKKRSFLKSDSSIKRDTISFLKKSNDLGKIHNVFFKWYKTRNNIKIKKLNSSYKVDLVKRIPINIDNIDIYLQIDFFMAFLDSKFNNEDIYQLFNNDVSPSSKAFKYVEHPFNYEEDQIENVLEKIIIKSKDSLWIKYYLEEEGINNMLLFYDNNKVENIFHYNKLVGLINTPPNNLDFGSTKELINGIKDEIKFKTQWKGEYSFEYEHNHMGESSEGRALISVNHKDGKSNIDLYWKTTVDETGEITDKGDIRKELTVVRITKDTLELKGAKKEQYVLYKENGESDYAIKGQSIYTLSPPKNHYPLTKK
ncbi:hypothetical protein G1K97_12115 [Tenacibaculum finnmarkense]|uniref:hypothetical protein n=1 Tax=Tenacibaculum finnmarkense TaxID=2781243 RepID=UPI001EFC0971|nr:hypothetical protein [Tenacibaculum finnmarkense]MCG8894400.1 hypothetical protein [Tenacibaculum finnmarkense]MCG8902581.1 hypothetical protein [Tenacibaculum finnmarkense]